MGLLDDPRRRPPMPPQRPYEYGGQPPTPADQNDDVLRGLLGDIFNKPQPPRMQLTPDQMNRAYQGFVQQNPYGYGWAENEVQPGGPNAKIIDSLTTNPGRGVMEDAKAEQLTRINDPTSDQSLPPEYRPNIKLTPDILRMLDALRGE